jgi:hypothetical protein
MTHFVRFGNTIFNLDQVSCVIRKASAKGTPLSLEIQVGPRLIIIDDPIQAEVVWKQLCDDLNPQEREWPDTSPTTTVHVRSDPHHAPAVHASHLGR